MKNKLINFSITTIVISILGVILTLIISLLSSLNIINNQINDIIMISLSLVLFFLYGFIFGLKEKKRGLINGLLIVVIYLIFNYTFKLIYPQISHSSWYIVLARCSLIVLGTLIGVNSNHA